MGPELDLDELVNYPGGSLGYTDAKVLEHLGYAAHFYGDRPSIDEETDYVTALQYGYPSRAGAIRYAT